MGLTDEERNRVAALRLMIAEGLLAVGESHTFVGVAVELGTDAAGAAAAVRELGRDGFIELLPEGRFRVDPDAATDVDDLVEVRLLLEPWALRRAAACVRVADLITLRELAAAVADTCRRADFDDYFEAVEGFYATVLSLLPNRPLAELVLDLRHRTRLDGARQIVEAGLRGDVEPEFGTLVDLIEARDLDGVEALVRCRVGQLRYLGAPRRERGEPWPLIDAYPANMVPVDGEEPADLGW